MAILYIVQDLRSRVTFVQSRIGATVTMKIQNSDFKLRTIFYLYLFLHLP